MLEKKILVIEDDRQLNEQLTGLLIDDGYLVENEFDGEQGLTAALTNSHDLIILDIMMPIRDGLSMLKVLRKTNQIPVILLSAKGAEEERITGFYQGADDYITKPFNATELLLRIEAILRRSQSCNKKTTVFELQLDNIYLNKAQGMTSVDEKIIELTPIQFRLLWTLMLYQGEVLSKAFLYQIVLNRTLGPHDRSLDMHLSRVRRKIIAAGGAGERLQTVHGEGYCLS